MERCETCRFWLIEGESIGICRASPPSLLPRENVNANCEIEYTPHYPRTFDDDLCRHYKASDEGDTRMRELLLAVDSLLTTKSPRDLDRLEEKYRAAIGPQA